MCVYSYLSSKMHAAQLWHKCFAADETPRGEVAEGDDASEGEGGSPLSRAAGERLRREILQRGGAAPPGDILRDFLGGEEPAIGPLLTELRFKKTTTKSSC